MFNRKKIAAAALSALASVHVAYAQGLDFVGDTTDGVSTMLDEIAVPAVTIAIIIAGLGMLFFRFSGDTAIRIVFGGALIGAAAELAAWLVG